MQSARRQHRERPSRAATLAMALVAAAPAHAADLPPAVVASFTQRVQPLLLNRCAAGACHGGPDAPTPRLKRAPGGAPPDRLHTRANLVAVLDAIGPERDPRRLAALLAAGHPAAAGSSVRRAAALTPPERVTLDRWLAEVRAAEGFVGPSGVVTAAAELPLPATKPSNRFRALLDAEANPPDLPPPEEPRGVIFKQDEPPAE